jgi:hypothetical protein
MRINSLYSYPYLNQQKPLFLPIIAYTLSSTKLEIRAKVLEYEKLSITHGCQVRIR